MNRRQALKYLAVASAGGAATYLGFNGQSLIAAQEGSDVISEPVSPQPITVANTNINNTGMKVLLLNGSFNKQGCTYTALKEVADTLERNGVSAEIMHIANKPISGCRGCNACQKTGRCVIVDRVNPIIDRADEFGGFIFGSPVHYASASGYITPFLDRLFYAGEKKLAFKLGASIASCRRSGSMETIDQMNRYFTFNNMPIVSAQYWTMVHGFTPDDVRKDEEGMQTMRSLGTNMAWMLKCIQAAKNSGIELPQTEERIYTNFIR